MKRFAPILETSIVDVAIPQVNPATGCVPQQWSVDEWQRDGDRHSGGYRQGSSIQSRFGIVPVNLRREMSLAG